MATDTSKYKFNHTMLRIKDPEKTLAFYKLFALTVVHKLPFPDNKFDLYFLGRDASVTNEDTHWTDRRGLIELTHNYGTENDDNFKISTGNVEPHLGFKSLAISVDSVTAVKASLEQQGHKLQKDSVEADEFAQDPDGYRVYLVDHFGARGATAEELANRELYRMNRTSLRVKDAEKSLAFYQEVLGMRTLYRLERSFVPSTTYALGYNGTEVRWDEIKDFVEGILELTWYHGTEKDADYKYHDGNAEPQGFGHIAISVDDLDTACTRFEEKNVNWKKRLTDGRMKNVAFLLDPDGYWVEVIQNEKLKERSKW